MPSMTEAEWLQSSEPKSMLHRRVVKEVSRRKLCLFACACCRVIWHLLDKDSQRVVEVAEHVADGIASPEELRTPCQAVFNHINDDWFSLERGARAAIEAANVISTISITSA